jgi:hypothetical protein
MHYCWWHPIAAAAVVAEEVDHMPARIPVVDIGSIPVGRVVEVVENRHLEAAEVTPPVVGGEVTSLLPEVEAAVMADRCASRLAVVAVSLLLEIQELWKKSWSLLALLMK